MLIFLEIADHLLVDSLVLQGAVQNDKHLGGDGPVVQVGDVALEDEFECADWADCVIFIFIMLAIKTFEKI